MQREELEQRIRALVDGEKGAYQALLAGLREAPDGTLVELAGHDAGGVRRAAVEAARGRRTAEVQAAIEGLASDPLADVRREVAQFFAETEEPGCRDETLRELLEDTDSDVRAHAARAAAGCAALHDELRTRLREDDDWEVRQAAARSLAGGEAQVNVPALLEAFASDHDSDVWRACAQSLEHHFQAAQPGRPSFESPPVDLLKTVRERVKPRRNPLLCEWLDECASETLDLGLLTGFGADLTALAEAGTLPRTYFVEPRIEAIREVLTGSGSGSRSVVLHGPAGAGKTAVVHELVHRLAQDPDEPWRVIRVSPADMLAERDTMYIGVLQARVRELVEAASWPKRVLLYVPNLELLGEAGRTNQSDLNIASQLAPYVENGQITILGETTPEAWRQRLGSNPSLGRLYTRIDVPGLDRGRTREILELVAAETGREASATFLDRLMELADAYLQGVARPGRSVGLLRRVLEVVGSRELEPRHVLETLSKSTGIPVDVLDDDVPLDLEELREFLESRVMGQSEAVQCVLDLVTLVKAGLTDPGKPFGVLLFVGPTGVGKTELARTLAELLFGHPDRLLRFDMSEYASYEAHERLIGRERGTGVLIEAVRERPFSVVLLDEIEKAHQNVFDLCLQIFDAGRLTDGRGCTVDFRNTIVILTSNVGSNVPAEERLGFGRETPAPPDSAAAMVELRRFFRPEFLNRLDRVVHFRPLAVETADRIARREVVRVVERSGIVRRDLTVDVDPSVLSLLLREGYSPAFGARPLKRTVERLVLLPIARAVAGGAVPPGTVMRLVARGGQVAIELVEPEESGSAAPAGRPAGLEVVRERVEDLQERAAPLEARKEELIECSSAPDFWERHDHAKDTLDELHRVDRVLEDVQRLARDLQRTATNPHPSRAARFLERHEREVQRLGRLIESGELGDAFVTITRVKAQGDGLDGVLLLARMYQAFARRQRLECCVLDDRLGGEPAEDTITLQVAGAGAYVLLRGEHGLHQLVRQEAGNRRETGRELVRVEVLQAPAEEGELPRCDLRLESRPLHGVRGRLISRLQRELRLLHAPSLSSARVWTDLPQDEARRQLEFLLRARVESGAAGDASPTRVRVYRFGVSPLVRDRRTGRSTGKLGRVLQGELDLLFPTDP